MPTWEDIRLLQEKREIVLKRTQDILERLAGLNSDLAYYEKAFDHTENARERRELQREIDGLKTQIKDVETELREKEQEFKAMNVLSDSDLLREAFCNLNYCEQVDVFQEALKKSFVLAFLIHGKQEYGQPWLLYRLEQKLLSHQGKICDIEKVRFELNSQLFERTTDELWRKLGRKIGLTNAYNLDKEAIVKRILKWLETKNVIFIFNDLHEIEQVGMEQLLKDFWHPLIEQVRNAPGQSCKYYLLLFLIDKKGHVHNWSYPFTEKITFEMKASEPIKLAILNEFTDDVIDRWISSEGARWQNLFEDGRPKVQEIMRNSNNGVPQEVLEYICSLCGYRWDETGGWVIYDQQST